MSDKTVSPREAARLLDLGLNYIYVLLWSGKLSAVKTEEGHWRIPLTAINERLRS
jgi:excisionase family DNA binding protein